MSTPNGLRPGECRIVFTRNEWNMLHHLLAIAQERPDIFGGTEDVADAATYLLQTATRIKSKLPPPGAGTY